MEQTIIKNDNSTRWQCSVCGGLTNFKPEKCICGSTEVKLISFTLEREAKAKEELAKQYKVIIDILKSYIDTTEDNYKIISMWIIGTYFHNHFDTFPYLFLNAMRGSGKTRSLKLISTLGANGDGSVQNNLTEAVLFRIPKGTTTCIDEVEQIGHKEKQTLRELLNSAYKKGMKVKRMRKVHNKEGERQEAEVFEPYFPICMANIWGVEEVLADRSIVLILEKSSNPAIVMKIEDFNRSGVIKNCKRALYALNDVISVTLQEKTYIERWNQYIDQRYKQNIELIEITEITEQTSSQSKLNEQIEFEEFFNKIHDLGIYGRNFELFFPLLIIAQTIGEEVFNDFCRIASSSVDKKKEEEYTDSKDVSLYEFIANEVEQGEDFIPIKDLTQRFRMFLGESDSEDAWLNEKWFGRALKRLNICLQSRKFAMGRRVILDIAKAREKLKIFQGGKDAAK